MRREPEIVKTADNDHRLPHPFSLAGPPASAIPAATTAKNQPVGGAESEAESRFLGAAESTLEHLEKA
jgi:hypothetical protein